MAEISPHSSSTTGRSATARHRVVGVVHLAALPDTARGGVARDLPAILDAARRDAAVYAVGGVDAGIVENFGDVPFPRDRVGAFTVAAMTLAVAAIRSETSGSLATVVAHGMTLG